MGDSAKAGLGKTPEHLCSQKPIAQAWRLRPGEAQRQAKGRGLQESSMVFVDILVQSEGPGCLHSDCLCRVLG